MTATQPGFVRIVEVGPRDGLQNEGVILPTQDKIGFIEMLAASGLRDIEAASFVSPQRVPQMADANAIFAGLTPSPGVRYSALVPNARGLERALAAGVRAIALFTAGSETFTQRNIGMSIGQSLDVFRALMPTARANGLWVRAYISMAFVCPYEGAISPAQVLPVVQALVDMGVDEISLGDTIGHATPGMVVALTEALSPVLPKEQTAYHFHDTQGQALENVRTALKMGISIFDAAAGGTGGCPFAPGAPGNLATESLLDLLASLGIKTGVDRTQIVQAAQFIRARLAAGPTMRGDAPVDTRPEAARS